MATKSIFKNIRIDNRRKATVFVRALENASKAQPFVPKYNHLYSDASREDIRKMFGATNGRV